MTDKTFFAEGFMHMIKANLNINIITIPVFFALTGLVSGVIGLPVLCLIATYCVHLLIISSQHLESKMNWVQNGYSEVTKGAFKTGPRWMRSLSGIMSRAVDTFLVMFQISLCCGYIVLMVENIQYTLMSHRINNVDRIFIHLILLPFAILLSCIKTLKRLAIVSACATVLQVIGISIVIQYFIYHTHSKPEAEYFKPASQVATGFGSVMFLFEGISLVLPIYTQMKQQSGKFFKLINISYLILLALYVAIGLMGYLMDGDRVLRNANILTMVPEDSVRFLFIVALLLTYPLQFYGLHEIVGNCIRARFFNSDKISLSVYNYGIRTLLVLVTFMIAIPLDFKASNKMTQLMFLVGLVSGTALSIILPPLIHIATFWVDTSGLSKVCMVVVDVFLIIFGLIMCALGSIPSFMAIDSLSSWLYD